MFSRAALCAAPSCHWFSQDATNNRNEGVHGGENTLLWERVVRAGSDAVKGTCAEGPGGYLPPPRLQASRPVSLETPAGSV